MITDRRLRFIRPRTTGLALAALLVVSGTYLASALSGGSPVGPSAADSAASLAPLDQPAPRPAGPSS